MTEFSKWVRLFGLLAAIAILVYLFMVHGPKFLAEHLSTGFMVLPIAMTLKGLPDRTPTPIAILILIVTILCTLVGFVAGARVLLGI